MAGYLGSKAVLLSTTAATVTGNATVGGSLTAGSATISGDLTVDGATDGTAVALLRADNTGVTKKNTLRFEDTDTTTQNDQQLGRIEFYSNDTDHTGVDAVIEAVSATTGLKELRFLTSDTANTPLSRLAINKGGDISFYEDTGTTPKFFWDASTERLGIGTTSPSSALEIAHEGTYGLTISSTGNTAGMRIIGDSDDSGSGIQEWEINVISGPLTFSDNTAAVERMRIDSSGNLLVGTTNSDPALNNVSGFAAEPQGRIQASRNGAAAGIFNRLSTNGDIVAFRKNGTTVGSIATYANNRISIGNGSTYLAFYLDQIIPSSGTANRDNAIDLGGPSVRFDDIYATNGTIQTSDHNEKQDIAELDEAEKRVAVACKGLIRKYRWKDAVAEKGDAARIHVGIIAQDLQDAFAAEGLNAHDYAMFISATWWEHDGQTYETAEEAPEGAVEKTRLGVRYPELLAFIIGAM